MQGIFPISDLQTSKDNCKIGLAGSTIVCGDGFQEKHNGCIMAVDAPTALGILGDQATFEEMRVLGAFQYASRY